MRIVVVGSGAGGSLAARELAKASNEVVILEAGGKFEPMSRRVTMTEPLRRVGLLGSERTIRRFLPSMWVGRSSEDLVLVRGMCAGGSTAIACGNLVRATSGLDEIGLDLTPEFQRLERELKPTIFPKERWRPTSIEMFRVAESMGLRPEPTPKAMEATRCEACGLCEVGCATGAKWDARRWLREAERQGAKLLLESPVTRIKIEKGQASSVEIFGKQGAEVIRADAVVLAAGGIGSAQILRSSGLPVADHLWADIVLTIGGCKQDADMLCEPPMVWYTKHDRFILSPYMDVLSHWFHQPWRKIGLHDRVGVMIKLADEANGVIGADGEVHKALTAADRDKLAEATAIVVDIMEGAGVKGPFVPGMLNGGHLGGTVPLQRQDIDTMHPSALPQNLYVADLSLLPKSQGMPTMLTAAALSMRVVSKMIEQHNQ
jgi:choline dehydrogenase-like flavoprotein